MHSTDQPTPTPARVKAFLTFFKSYLGLWSVAAAALPLPLGAARLIPTYDAQRSVLATYTSLFCFLLVGSVFYRRHELAHLFFPSSAILRMGSDRLASRAVRWLPFILMILCFVSAIGYHALIRRTVELKRQAVAALVKIELTDEYVAKLDRGEIKGDEIDRNIFDEAHARMAKRSADLFPGLDKYTSFTEYTLKETDLTQIPFSWLLMGLYLAIFLTADGAFVLMALKEYLQDAMNISESDLLDAQPRAAAAHLS